MAKESVALLDGKIDVKNLVDVLNAALAEEWMAYYQYWTAAQIVIGPHRMDLQREFMKHAGEELNHATMICRRIIELDGMPLTTPQEWYKVARCVYGVPEQRTADYFLMTIKGAEQCAMHRYQELAQLTEGKDYITNDLAKFILGEEAEHEQDLQDFIDDLEDMKSNVCRCKCDCDCGDECDCSSDDECKCGNDVADVNG